MAPKKPQYPPPPPNQPWPMAGLGQLIRDLRTENRLYREDLEAASTELLIDIPAVGTEMTKMVTAN